MGRVPPWVSYLAVGVALTAVYFLFPRGGTAQSVLYDAIGVSAAVAIAAGGWLNRPARRWPWWLFALGILAFSVGDIIFNAGSESPSVADVFYLAGYPLIAAGLADLVSGLAPSDRRAGAVEAAIVAAAFALVQWVYLMDAAVHDASRSVTDRVVNGALYPAMDVVLLAGLTAFFVGSSWRVRAYRMLVASIVLLLVADEVYAVGTYSNGSWVDALWLLSYVFWGAAALNPSMTALSEVERQAWRPTSALRLGLLACALLTAPAVLLVQRLRHAPLEALAVASAAGVLSLLVAARLAGIVRALERLRVRLAERNEQLVEADRLKDEFVALISHDLRTPLTSIMGFLELAQDPHTGELNEDQRTYLEIVTRNSERLLRLVNDLLFVARLQSGRLRLERAEQDLAAIARQSVDEARPRAAAKEIDLRFDAHDAPHVDGDKGRLFQLLENLISNAIKFTPEGGTVTVSVGRDGDGAAELVVADTGIGIPAPEQQRLFERFFRASGAVERQIPGTGLGLYIARAITEAHGGSIRVASDEGCGTRFTIVLPGSGR